MIQLDDTIQQLESESRINRVPTTLPVLPMRDMVIYPYVIQPLCVGRRNRGWRWKRPWGRSGISYSSRSASAVMEDPTADDLYTVGTVAECLQLLRLPEDTLRITVEGIARVKIRKFTPARTFLYVDGEVIRRGEKNQYGIARVDARRAGQFEQCIHLGNRIPIEALENVRNIEEPGRLADMISSYLGLSIPTETGDIGDVPAPDATGAAGRVPRYRDRAAGDRAPHPFQRSKKNWKTPRKNITCASACKAIQEELGERDDRSNEINELRQQIEKAGMRPPVHDKAIKELDRLERMPAASPEVTVTRTYLDWLIGMPWSERSEDLLDLDAAEAGTQRGSLGPEKAKERIIEYLAVRKLNPKMKGPILCFVGPPGVGKTSIGRSIARALGREFVRISLGGVRDEGEIRGHRRTYVGALPGRIMQGMKTAGTKNPVFMMDEIDKIGQDFRGDPSAALLEVLDPEQNFAFSDHYLEVPFDLSEVMFITTANLLDPIPDALRDRMEVIEFPGYTEDEKLKIAEVFLVPKQLKEHGLTTEQPALRRGDVAGDHPPLHARGGRAQPRTRDRHRCAAKSRARWPADKRKRVTVRPASAARVPGCRALPYGLAEAQDEIGVATGLGWTPMGGDMLAVEVGLMPGKGNCSSPVTWAR